MIFVSYARSDEAVAASLHGLLSAAGYDVWLDVNELERTPDWRARLEDAIERSDALAFVISPDALASEVCLHELRHALAHGKPVVVVQWREPDAGAVPPELAGALWIDARAGEDVAVAFRRLLAAA